MAYLERILDSVVDVFFGVLHKFGHFCLPSKVVGESLVTGDNFGVTRFEDPLISVGNWTEIARLTELSVWATTWLLLLKVERRRTGAFVREFS